MGSLLIIFMCKSHLSVLADIDRDFFECLAYIVEYFFCIKYDLKAPKLLSIYVLYKYMVHFDTPG